MGYTRAHPDYLICIQLTEQETATHVDECLAIASCKEISRYQGYSIHPATADESWPSRSVSGKHLSATYNFIFFASCYFHELHSEIGRPRSHVF